MRALRCDKITYSLLTSTLQLFLQGTDTSNRHLVLKQFTASKEDVIHRAEKVVSALREIETDAMDFSIEDTTAQAGSGTLPLESLPSVAVVIQTKQNINDLAKKLRIADPSVVGYLKKDKLYLDMRSCLETDIPDLIDILKTFLKNPAA